MLTAIAYVGLLALQTPVAQAAETAGPLDPLGRWSQLLEDQKRSSCVAPIYLLQQEVPEQESTIVQLLKVRRHENPALRRSAAAALGDMQLRSDLVVPALAASLRDRDERMREHATMALAKIGAPAVPALIELLDDVSVSLEPPREIGKDGQTTVLLSDLATIALAQTRAPVVEPLTAELRKLLQTRKQNPTRNRSARVEFASGYFLASAAFIIGQHGGKAVDDLIPLVSDKEPAVRSLALNALRTMRAHAAPAIGSIEKLIDKGGADAAFGVEVLAFIGGDALPALGNLLRTNGNPELRATAVSLLPWIGPEATSLLVRALEQDPTAKVRAQAAKALGEVDRAQGSNGESGIEIQALQGAAVLALGRALSDKDLSVRKKAAYGLGLIVDRPTPEAKRILPDLIAALKVPNADVQSEVASVLGAMGADAAEAVPSLMRALAAPARPDPDDVMSSDPRSAFVGAIGQIGTQDPQVVAALIRILQDASLSNVHTTTATALGKLGKLADQTVPYLSKLAQDEDTYGRQKVLGALAGISPAAVADLVMREDLPLELRIDACWILTETPEIAREAAGALAASQTLQERALRGCTASVLAVSSGINDKVGAVLLEVLGAPEGEDKWRLAEPLASLGKAATTLVEKTLETGRITDSYVLLEILKKVAVLQPELIQEQILPPLIKLLSASDAKTREAAAELIGELPLEVSQPAVDALVSLLKRELKPGSDLSLWKEIEPGHMQRVARPTVAALDALQRLGALAEPAVPYLASILDFPDPTVRRSAVSILGQIGPASVAAKEKLVTKLCDPDAEVRAGAAATLADLGLELDALGPSFAAVAIDDYLRTSMSAIYDDLADLLRPSPLMSGRFPGGLQPFPWPPPHYTHIAVFGRDFPRERLGTDDTDLQTVYKRLYDALQATDPGFESGLFSVPGGFALLARLERIEADGTPYPGKYHWVEGKVPPLSLTDYVGRLFFEESGYFRTIAFVVTDQQNFGSSDRRLPGLKEGGTDLPAAIGQQKFKGRNCYVLIYSFARKRGGQPVSFSDLSARLHLQRSGVLTALGIAVHP